MVQGYELDLSDQEYEPLNMNLKLFSLGTLTVVSMKNITCGVRRPCSLLEIHRRFVSPSVIIFFFLKV